MKLTPEQVRGMGVALNEAIFAGLEVAPNGLLAGATFSVLTLPVDGPEPTDPRRQFIFTPVGRLAASLRIGAEDDPNTYIKPFKVEELLETVQSFNGLPIYGWDFIDKDPEDFEKWNNPLSLDFIGDSQAMKHSITLFQEGVGDGRLLNICLWFNELHIFDAEGNPVSLDDFIAGGIRWWNALYAGDPRTKSRGIIPLRPSNPGPT